MIQKFVPYPIDLGGINGFLNCFSSGLSPIVFVIIFAIVLIVLDALQSQGSLSVNFRLSLSAETSVLLVFDDAIILEAPADDSDTIPIEIYEFLDLLR